MFGLRIPLYQAGTYAGTGQMPAVQRGANIASGGAGKEQGLFFIIIFQLFHQEFFNFLLIVLRPLGCEFIDDAADDFI